jgi:hypothetical protein
MTKAYPHTSKALAAAVLFVFVTSVACDALFGVSVGAGVPAEFLARIAAHATMLRISILSGLAAAAGILWLGAVLHRIFREASPILSLTAFAFYLAEGVLLAVSKLGAIGLLAMGREVAGMAGPLPPYLEASAAFLRYGLYDRGYDIHWLCFCLGGLIWYSLLYRERLVPTWLSLWGLASLILVTANNALVLYDPDIGRIMPLLIPYIPFELVLGLWLWFKGFNPSPRSESLTGNAPG